MLPYYIIVNCIKNTFYESLIYKRRISYKR